MKESYEKIVSESYYKLLHEILFKQMYSVHVSPLSELFH